MLKVDKERLGQTISKFSEFGATGDGGITRLSLSEPNLQARKEFTRRMEDIGATVKYDDMANMYARIEGTDSSLPAIVIGSHTDSVIQGGNYDGILGVITGIEVLETIVKNKVPHRHPLVAMVWTNEEGARFDPAMMSSGVICNKFDKVTMLKSTDTEGVTFEQALEASGYKGSEENRLNADDYKAMLELHIEQGPVLESGKFDIGAVAGVVGMVNYEFEFKGQSGHSGTVPMPWRKDALYAATKAIEYLHENLDKLDSDLVYTTGRINCKPNVHTIIPNNVKFTLDSRHKDPEVIKSVVKIVEDIPKELVGCEVVVHELWSRKTVDFNETLIKLVEESSEEYGYTNKRMYSGAGHDAQYVADMMPSTMIFVPSIGGHSHTEIEATPLEDCWKGVNVALQTVIKLDKIDTL